MDAVEEVKSRIDILDLAHEYTQVKKAGRSHKGLCPFHTEKTPSFVVFPETQTYRCFGCGRGGDVFNFIMDAEGYDFRGALAVLAERAGVELKPETPAQAQIRDKEEHLLGILANASDFFYRQLLEAPQAEYAREYVQQRGLSWETIEQFQIGYAPNSWDAMRTYLTDLGYELDAIVEAGLVIVKDEGAKVYDRFRNRLVIPIYNTQGHVVGFGARILDPNDVPKYLNSPQSFLFDKSTLLYGFHMARRAIRETETAVIVEGYMDVIQAHQAGFENVVAQMGTAFTTSQLKVLSRYARTIVLALDPDAAGQMATDRGRDVIAKASIEAAQHVGDWALDSAESDHRVRLTAEFDANGMLRYESDFGFDIRVVRLPEGQDPDDLIRYEPQTWVELIEGAESIVEYAITNATIGKNLDDPKIKARIAEDITPLINSVSNNVERSHYRQMLARILQIPEHALMVSDAPSKTKRPTPSGQPAQAKPPPLNEMFITGTPTATREAFCLAAMLQYPRLLYRANRILSANLDNPHASDDLEQVRSSVLLGYVTPEDFAQSQHRYIFETWLYAIDQHDLDPIHYLLEEIEPSARAQIEQWLDTPLSAFRAGVQPDQIQLTQDQVGDQFVQGMLELRCNQIERRIEEIIFMTKDGTVEMGHLEQTLQVSKLFQAKQQLTRARHENTLSGKLSAKGL